MLAGMTCPDAQGKSRKPLTSLAKLALRAAMVQVRALLIAGGRRRPLPVFIDHY